MRALGHFFTAGVLYGLIGTFGGAGVRPALLTSADWDRGRARPSHPEVNSAGLTPIAAGPRVAQAAARRHGAGRTGGRRVARRRAPGEARRSA